MKKSFVTILIIFWAAAPASFSSSEKVTLEKAVLKALMLQSGYKNALLSEKEASIRTSLADINRRFILNFDSSYRYISDTMEIETPSVTIPGFASIPSNTIKAGVFHNFDFKLSAAQPLFSGGALKNSMRLSEIRQAVEGRKTEIEKLEIAAAVKSSFFSYLGLIRKKQSLETLNQSLNLHIERLQNLFNEGLVRKTDLLETRSRKADIDISLGEIDGLIKEAGIHFKSLCGYAPSAVEEGFSEQEIPLEAAKEYFIKNHPVLKSLSLRVKALDLQNKISIGRYKPQVTAFAELHYGRPGIDFFKKEWGAYFAGGIALRMPVFHWNRLQSEKRLNGIQIEKITNERDEFIREIFSLLDKLYEKLEVLEKTEQILDRLTDISQEDADLKAELVKERQIPNIEYLTALLRLEQQSFKKRELAVSREQIKIQITKFIGHLEAYHESP